MSQNYFKNITKNLVRSTTAACVVVSFGLGLSLLSGCGENPFGAGSYSLKSFTNFAKKMEKPKSIHEEEADESNSKAAIAASKSSLVSLAKFGSSLNKVSLTDKEGVIEEGFEASGDTAFVYYQILKDKPSEEDPEKLETGRAQILFEYAGDPTMESADTAKISQILTWSFEGTQQKTWLPGHLDSVSISIDFSQGSTLGDFKPGFTSFRAWNISQSVELGLGDTAVFTLDSLDDTKKEQYGSGSFFDKNTGAEHDEPSRTFDFDLTILHKNLEDESQPYKNYKDNEGVMEFDLVYTEGADDLHLHFKIHFFPGYEREGMIYKKVDGELQLVTTFTHNEKTGKGVTKWYNDKGEVVEREEF